jgi:5-methyltetrahydropteroyltriglutamate--homocysteine methyltransferase
MNIPTEPIGSIPRPTYLVEELSKPGSDKKRQESLTERAIKETISLFEESGSPVVTDGEQAKPSFATYPIHGMQQLSPNGVVIPFADGHTRQLPVITSGPFRYQTYASEFLKKAREFTALPLKQAVISASALSLLYPKEGIPNYSREDFIKDLVNEAEKDIRGCLDHGAHCVQIDFTEARLAIKLDPSKALLKMFIDLNNQVLNRFTAEERKRIGVHTCPGGDHDSTHSADVPYRDLLPDLFNLNAGNFYLEYAAEKNKTEVLKIIKETVRAGQRVYLGVIDVLDPKIETGNEVCDLIVEAAKYIPLEQLGTCDDCGFSPFADDTSTARETAFAKIKARIEGTKLAEKKLAKA